MTIHVSVTEVQAHFPEFLAKVQQGEEVAINQNGTELARLVPARQPAKRREPGLDAGKVIFPDFDTPLPDDVLAAFEGAQKSL
jgi:prevent-host-death family protein